MWLDIIETHLPTLHIGMLYVGANGIHSHGQEVPMGKSYISIQPDEILCHIPSISAQFFWFVVGFESLKYLS